MMNYNPFGTASIADVNDEELMGNMPKGFTAPQAQVNNNPGLLAQVGGKAANIATTMALAPALGPYAMIAGGLADSLVSGGSNLQQGAVVPATTGPDASAMTVSRPPMNPNMDEEQLKNMAIMGNNSGFAYMPVRV